MPKAETQVRPPRSIRAMLRAAVCVFALLAPSFSGCANHQQELIESELRKRESELDEMKAKLGAKDSEVQALEIELDMCHRKHLQDAKGKCAAPAGTVLFVQKITLGRSTGGYRQNETSEADDSLLVMLEPKDADDSTIKAPGSVKIDVFEVTTAGLKNFLSSWEVAPRELRRLWESPLIGGAGYRLLFPWKAYPTTERIKIVARFTTLDGQQYEAEKETTVRLLDLTKGKKGGAFPPGLDPIHVPLSGDTPPQSVAPPPRTRPGLLESLAPKTTGKPISLPAGPSKSSDGFAPPPAIASPPSIASPPASKSDEELPMSQPLRSPTGDPPLTFEMKPFSSDWEPIIQVGHREEPAAQGGERAPKLGPPQRAKPPRS